MNSEGHVQLLTGEPHASGRVWSLFDREELLLFVMLLAPLAASSCAA